MSPDVPDPLAAGLLDRDWVGAQLGTVFASDEDAAARCLEPEADCSPHPLYEPSWGGVSPHPLVDVARIVAEQTQVREMIIEGIVSIVLGENPRAIESKLHGFLH